MNMNMNSSLPLQSDEWLMKETEESKNILEFITGVIEKNMNTREKGEICSKVGGTYVSVYTKITGEYKTHRFFILFPFDKRKSARVENPQNDYDYDHPLYPYVTDNKHIFMKDFYFYADKTFHSWMYNEMVKTYYPIIGWIGDDKMSWKLTHSNPILYALDYKNDMDETTFDEWYERKDYKTSFSIQITNPYLYSVPFLCKPYIYNYDSTFRKNNLI